MCKLLKDWLPSEAAIDLIKLNGFDDKQVKKSLTYLKSQTELSNIDAIEGYENWNTFFIMFCVKANINTVEEAN